MCDLCIYLLYEGDEHRTPHPNTKTTLPAAQDSGPPRLEWVSLPRTHIRETPVNVFAHILGARLLLQDNHKALKPVTDPGFLSGAWGERSQWLPGCAAVWKLNWRSRPAAYR